MKQGRRLTMNLWVGVARAVAASGIFRLRLGPFTLGRGIATLLRPVLVPVLQAPTSWPDTPLTKILRAILPPVPLCSLMLDSYEPETTRLFRKLLRPGMTVVDIGAAQGHYTLLAAMNVGAAGHVYAFEPDPHLLRVLRQHVQITGFENTVTIVPMAISDGSGQAELFLAEAGLSSLFVRRVGGEGSVVVETVSLDGYFADLGWPRVDVMKMDIEGAETLALRGMAELARRNPHMKLIIEFWPAGIRAQGSTAEDFFQALGMLGFTRICVASDRREQVRVPQDIPWLLELAAQSRRAGFCVGVLNLLCEREHA